MSLDKKFLLVILVSIVLFVLTGLVIFNLKLIGWEVLRGLFLSQLICLVYSAIGYGFIRLAYKAPGSAFVSVVLGGIILRLFVMLILIIICIKLLNVKEDIFILSLLVFYIYFMILEVYYLIKKDGFKLR